VVTKQLRPAEFGPYPGDRNVSTDEQLLDRQRLADIVTGDS
jgi:hypothetical protein